MASSSRESLSRSFFDSIMSSEAPSTLFRSSTSQPLVSNPSSELEEISEDVHVSPSKRHTVTFSQIFKEKLFNKGTVLSGSNDPSKDGRHRWNSVLFDGEVDPGTVLITQHPDWNVHQAALADLNSDSIDLKVIDQNRPTGKKRAASSSSTARSKQKLNVDQDEKQVTFNDRSFMGRIHNSIIYPRTLAALSSSSSTFTKSTPWRPKNANIQPRNTQSKTSVISKKQPVGSKKHPGKKSSGSSVKSVKKATAKPSTGRVNSLKSKAKSVRSGSSSLGQSAFHSNKGTRARSTLPTPNPQPLRTWSADLRPTSSQGHPPSRLNTLAILCFLTLIASWMVKSMFGKPSSEPRASRNCVSCVH